MFYFIVEKPTPLLNTPHFRQTFSSPLPFDSQNLIREVEMIALPEMVFEVVRFKKDHILEVKTHDYWMPKLFIDRRFGRTQKHRPTPIKRPLPSMSLIIERMKKYVGLPYVWGGNYATGIPEWKEYYPPGHSLSEFEEAHWCFKGLDCSGLLYAASEGRVPRNTREQMKMGVKVSIDSLQPLDLLLFPGHLLISLSKDLLIESFLGAGGVTITPLEERIKDLPPLVVKRFHPETLSP